MPPLIAGLLKRKKEEAAFKDILNRNDKNSSGNDEEAPDLLRPVLRDGGDLSDDDADAPARLSDADDDSVLYGDDDGTDAGSSSEDAEDTDAEEAEGEGRSSSDLTDSDISDEDDDEDDDVDAGDAREETPSEEGGAPAVRRAADTLRRASVVDGLTTNIATHTRSELIRENKKGARRRSATAGESVQRVGESTSAGERDEFASGDSSDEEDRRNTAGAVPAWWYDDYPHVGYDLDGRRLLRAAPPRDRIEQFLRQCEDPEFWRTVRDPSTGQDVVLSAEDLELLARLTRGRAPDPHHDEYAPWVEWFSSRVLATPVRAFPEHKRSFLPSQSEQKKISRLVHALKMGWIKSRKQEADERRSRRERRFYDLWGSSADDEARARGVHKHIAAPRRPLPGHAESYNPPAEYLLDAKELKEWNKLKTTPWKRKYTFMPSKFGSLRVVPAYERYVRERFLRCLDLYLAPRAIKMRLTIEPQDLVPKLPSPRDLQPFPTTEALVFRAHAGAVRSIDVDPSGQYLVSGGDDATVRVWETSTGRCVRTVRLEGGVRCVAWTPAGGLALVAACVGRRLLLLNPGAGVGDHRVAERTDRLLEEPPPARDLIVDERTATAAQWEKVAPEDWVRGVRISIHHFKDTKQVQWHGRGDYLCCTLPDGASRAVVVHQLSRRRSQLPFSKAKGLVQCALFHPVRPFLFVATQRAVRVYDLVKQELVRKLLTGAQWISTMAVHPAGDNLLVASYDRKMMWFDLDLSSAPYQTLRLHGSAVRAVAFHKRYPLFASAGDDLKVIVSHGMVYNDLLQSPLIVPLKQLWGHERHDELGVLDLRFHPAQPWLFSAGADGTVRLFT